MKIVFIPSKVRSAFRLAILTALGYCLIGETIRIPTKQPGAGALFQIRRGTKWGYMDRAGHVVIHPQFDDEGDFFEGLAKVRISDHWCYIDEKGRVAIPCIYEAAGDFHEGLAPVQIQRKWGFTNTAGI